MKRTIPPIIAILVAFYIFYPLAQLYVFDQSVVELPMTSYYLVRVPESSNEVAVFSRYMEERGFEQITQLGGLHRYQRGQEILSVTNNQLKTMP